MTTLVAAIVSHFSDAQMLTATVQSLARAAGKAGIVTRLVLVDNSDDGSDAARLEMLVREWRQAEPVARALRIGLLRPGGNRGYGAGNNAALAGADEAFVLILNPDAVLTPDALVNALAALDADPGHALLAPRALDTKGRDLHLGHGYPSALALAGRSIAWLQRFAIVRQRMADYELRQYDHQKRHTHIVCASGCFMFLRRCTWEAIGGFDPTYFLYFEDYDLSMRVRRLGRIVYEPDVRITHLGGDASRKGWRHTWWFARSALRFFRRHGMRWA